MLFVANNKRRLSLYYNSVCLLMEKVDL
jgi:hypothetical protein